MITKLVPNMDLTKTYPGVILEDKTVTFNDDTVPLYIPIIMCDIGKSAPQISRITTFGNTIFSNADECKPRSNSMIKQQNYLLGHKEDMDIDSKYSLKSGSKVQVSFTQGKISSISFKINSLMDI